MAKVPTILISNDDGFHAPGMRAMRQALEGLGRLIVCCPDSEQSATSHALTLHRPLRIAKVEEDGFGVTGHVAALTMRAKLRGLRDDNGVPIFNRTVQAASMYELDGAPVEFPRNGSMDAATALMFTGDWSQLVYAMRQDITYKILTEAVIQDGSGTIVYNLAQQDMVALRAVMRLGWQLPNPINRVNTSSSTRYPFSVLVPAG